MIRSALSLSSVLVICLAACSSETNTIEETDPVAAPNMEMAEAPQDIATEPKPGYPEGTYILVSARRASDVAGPPVSTEAIPFGSNIEFISPTDIRMEGVSCDDWQILGSNSPTIFPNKDPLLFDISLSGDGVADHRHNITYEIFCEGEAVTKFLRVDDRVLVFPDQNSALNIVFEKPLSAPEITQLQEALTAAGLDAGDVNGVLSEATIQAVRSWLLQHPKLGEFQGVPARPAITENLLSEIASGIQP